MSNSNAYKIFRVFLFLIPIIIMIIMSFFFGKQGAAARFFRFKTTIRFIIFTLVFLAALFWTLYTIFFSKDENDKKYIKTDIVITIFLFFIFIISLLYWRWSLSISNNTASKMQYLNTTLNAARTTRNMIR